MAADSTRTRQATQHCPNCLTALRPRDRFCPACGMRLERPDLRADGRLTPPPSVPSIAPRPPAPAPAALASVPTAPPSPPDRGLAAALTAVLLVVMLSLTIALLVVVAGSESEPPKLVTSPQVVTVP